MRESGDSQPLEMFALSRTTRRIKTVGRPHPVQELADRDVQHVLQFVGTHIRHGNN